MSESTNKAEQRESDGNKFILHYEVSRLELEGFFEIAYRRGLSGYPMYSEHFKFDKNDATRKFVETLNPTQRHQPEILAECLEALESAKTWLDFISVNGQDTSAEISRDAESCISKLKSLI